MSQALLQVRVDKGPKEQTAAIYDAIGIDLPTAIRMFLKRTVMGGGLPFEGKLIMRDNAAQRAFASMRQKVEMSQEGEPTLDEINEYISSVRRSRKPAGTTTSLQACDLSCELHRRHGFPQTQSGAKSALANEIAYVKSAFIVYV